jgi:hypothetical protein
MGGGTELVRVQGGTGRPRVVQEEGHTPTGLLASNDGV